MLKIAFKNHDDSFEPKVWKFPCGEVGVQLPPEVLQRASVAGEIGIALYFESNDDLFALAQVVDAIRALRFDHNPISLWMSYFPYARQDRRVNVGEAHALKVACAFINSLDFKYVVVDDPHSTVLESLLDRVVIQPQEKLAVSLPKFDILIAPDAGAEKKIFKHSQVANEGTEVICATKERNAEGKIVKTFLPFGGKLKDKTACIVDDICDGGATFLELGRVARQFEPKELCLYVTHGMFTNPEKFVELNDMFDRIFVYNMRPEADSKFGSYVEKL